MRQIQTNIIFYLISRIYTHTAITQPWQRKRRSKGMERRKEGDGMENIAVFLWCADYQEHRERTTVGRRRPTGGGRKNEGSTIKTQRCICENVTMTVFCMLRR